MSNFPTLDGLNNISGDSASLVDIICETFIATTSAQVPTMIAGTNDNNAASTAFVDDAITTATADLVTTNTTQTLTSGTKYFTNNPQSLTSAAPTLNNEYTNKKYVDDQISTSGGSFVTIGGINQTLTTGVKTFTNLPESSATPTTANQLIPKNYADNNFVALTGSQTITGNKIFWPTTGTTTIRGTQCDIFADTTYLTGNTTSMSGTLAVFNSATSYFGGSLFNMYSTTFVVANTCNSFYIDASYNNFMGKETYINTPYFSINSGCLNFYNDAITTHLRSPTINMTSACTNFNVNAVNTNLSGTIATATTQSSSDNSTKLATTAFVNAYATANYMTLTSNQNVSGVKTYSTKQIFNAGTASSTYDNTSLTDMTIASNSGNGILDIAGGRIQTDTFGVSIAETLNLQLNESTFIQPNTSLSPIDEPVFTFGLNQSEGYVDIPAVPRSAQATKKINTGIFSWFSGLNQSTTFTISHSIVTTSLAGVGTMYEAEVYFYFQDINTGITRYTTGNLATTTGFTLLPLSTNIRPTITFTLTTATLQQGAYSIYGFSRVTDAYSLNAGILSVNWNLASPISSFATTQDYNTPKDYTFTSRNVYHCFRNYVAGIYIINNIATAQNIMLPIFYSCTDLLNITSQPTTSGAVPTTDGGAVSGEVGVGNYDLVGCNNKDNYWLVYPNYGLKVYNSTGWGGTVYINYRNKTNNPVVVSGTTAQAGSSCKIYFDSVELVAF